MDYFVKPAIPSASDYASKERSAQLKKWIMVGVGSFLVVLLAAVAIYFATREPEPVPGSVGSVPLGPDSGHDTPDAPVIYASEHLVTPGQSGSAAPANPSNPTNPTNPANPTAPMSSVRTPLLRFKAFMMKHWKIIVPIAVVFVMLLIAGITAVVVVTEQNRLAAEELARQKQIDEEDAKWWRDYHKDNAKQGEEEPDMSLYQIIMTVATVHGVLCLCTVLIVHALQDVDSRKLALLFFALLFTGHSFLILLVISYAFLERFIVDAAVVSLPAKIAGFLLLPVYAVLTVLAAPFTWVFCDKLELLGGGTTKDTFKLISKVMRKIF